MDAPILGALQVQLSRRKVLKAALIGGTFTAGISLLAACGDDDTDTDTEAGAEADDDSDEEDEDGPEDESDEEDEDGPEDESDEEDEDEPDGESGSELGVVRMGQAFDLDTLDPTRVVQTPWRRVYGHLFDTLCHRVYDETGESEIVPRLAESWEREDDLSIVFDLREDVTFTNGEEFNAECVRFTWEKMSDPASQAAGTAGWTESIEIVDDYTVRVISPRPDAFLIDGYTDNTFIVPPETYEEMGAEEFSSNPIGTGAYVLEEWRAGDSIILRPNEDYWGGSPVVDQLVFRVIPEASTRVDALLANEVDIIEGVSPILAQRIEEADGARISVADGSPQPIIGGYLMDRPPFDDVRVRHAINYAINKEAIVERILQDFAEVMGQPCPSNTDCYNPELEPYPYDPERARELLDEAGIEELDVPMHFSSGVVVGGREVAQAIAADLAAVGINVEPEDLERGTFLDIWTDGVGNHERLADMWIMYYAAGVRPQNVILDRYSVSGDPWNASHYENPELDELILESRATFDEDERADLYLQITQIVHDDAPFIFLYGPNSIWGVADAIPWEAQSDDMMWILPNEYGAS